MNTDVVRDQRGKVSSIRVAVLVSLVIFGYLLYLFQKAFLLEIQKEIPNYTGLVTLFTGMVSQVGLVLLLKVFQTKYETDDNRSKRHRHDT